MPSRLDGKQICVMNSTHANITLLGELYTEEVEIPKLPIYVIVDKAVRAEIRRLEKKLGVEVEIEELDR